jgi:hypothetical protein
MPLSVKMSGENVADLSVATGKNDTEVGSHACGDPGTGFPGQFPVAPLGKMFIPITAAEAI